MVFNTEEKAKDYSRNEAVKRGCVNSTSYWWAIIKHPTLNKWAVNEENLSEDWINNKI